MIIEQPELSQLQVIILNLIYAVWAITPIITIINLIRIGVEYMFSQGDSQKVGELKQKAGTIPISLIVIFGSWLMVMAVINLIGLKDPATCFGAQLDEIRIQFVFPVWDCASSTK